MDTAAQETGSTADGRLRGIIKVRNVGLICLPYGLKRFFIVPEKEINILIQEQTVYEN